MAQETQDHAPSATTTGPKKKETPEEKKVKLVTSTKTVDFPSLGWGIHAGETLELPVEEAAQKLILEKDFITLIP